MAYKDIREWLAQIEEVGELRRITAEVDWDLELASIARRVSDQGGPALLFENIKEHQNTACRKILFNAVGSRERVAMALGLPRETGYREITAFIKGRLGLKLAPVIVGTGPVKQNIVNGDAVNLYELPVPKYGALDGGRYINTIASTVTMDPETRIMNVGMYRGMIGDNEKSIPVLLSQAQDWGVHFSKYEKRGEEMPVAIVYGWNPLLLFFASAPILHPDCSEYDLLGGMYGEPVELVKCETSDLYVPASAEIVVEGRISPDPKTFQMEGIFGEYPGFYGGKRQPQPTIRVECITYRDDPIFRGGTNDNSPGHPCEANTWTTPFRSAITWKALQEAGVPGITGVWGSSITTLTNLRIQIDKTFRGQAKQVAAALFGVSNIALYLGKNLIVVDKDIDIFDDQAMEWALAYRTNAAMGDIQFFSGTAGSNLDPSVPLSERDTREYGAGKWTRVFIDATVNWDLKREEQYGGRREPPLSTEIPAEIDELITRRWSEYGI